MIISKFPKEVVENFLLIKSILNTACSKSENDLLTILKILKLEQKLLLYYKKLEEYFIILIFHQILIKLLIFLEIYFNLEDHFVIQCLVQKLKI